MRPWYRWGMALAALCVVGIAVCSCSFIWGGVSQPDDAFTEEAEPAEVMPYTCVSDPQEVLDFLSEEAIQQCLNYHVFDDPNKWESNLYHLPFEPDRVALSSSSILCYRLMDDHYIYVRDHMENEGIVIDHLIFVNEEAGENIHISPELFPQILAAMSGEDAKTDPVDPSAVESP